MFAQQLLAFLHSGSRRHLSFSCRSDSPEPPTTALYMSSELDPDSTERRRLLFSLLAASGSAALAPFANAENSVQTKVGDEKLRVVTAGENWSTVNILKPPLDDRDYEAYMLDNGLKVVLCSDPTSNEVGAAMDVHVGACSDPKEVPGLAHFNEHMLFLGTKEYPKEDSFEGFLSANGGTSNAYTAGEDTVYHFTMQAEADEKFREGLKRFGSFFSSPLFTEGATGRELNAIESEHAKNLQSDNFRVYQIEKERQNSDHPHSKFFTGNKRTLLDDTKQLGLNLREELIKFYNEHYSANQMTLAVVGPQSLDTMKEMVLEAFGKIPNRNVPTPEDAWKGTIAPFKGNSVIPSFGHVVKIVPVQDLRQVTIQWPIVYRDDQDRTNALLTKQANYVAHLLGHEGPGSLLSYLKSKGWANALGTSGGSELSDFELFEATIGLTKAGLVAVDEVIGSVFSYISMLREKAIPSYTYSEVLQLEELQWRYSSKGGVSGHVQSLSTALRKYPPSLCVAGPRRLALCEDESKLVASSSPRTSFTSEAQFDFTKKLTMEFVENLSIDNAMFSVMSKTFQGETDKKEKWYGTEYSVQRVPEETLNRWKRSADPKSLGLYFPKPNPFIPSETGLRVKYPPPAIDRFRKRTFEDRMTPLPPPRIIRDDGPEGKWTVYYKPDDRFGQPKAFVIFQLLTKEPYSNAKNAALSNLYEFCLSDKLDEYAYDGKHEILPL